MPKRDFKVIRAHDGDRFYSVGDTRTADPNHVAELVRLGVLVDAGAEGVEDTAPKKSTRKKAAPKPANKSAPEGDDKAAPEGDDKSAPEGDDKAGEA